MKKYQIKLNNTKLCDKKKNCAFFIFLFLNIFRSTRGLGAIVRLGVFYPSPISKGMEKNILLFFDFMTMTWRCGCVACIVVPVYYFSTTPNTVTHHVVKPSHIHAPWRHPRRFQGLCRCRPMISFTRQRE